MWKTLLGLHFAVLLAGFTGVFGRLISYDAFILVFIRFLLAFTTMFLLVSLTGKLKYFSPKMKLQSTFVGFLLCLHLVFFYISIKESNVSIGTITISSTSFFTALLEPKLLKTRFNPYNLCFSFIICIGLFLIFNFDTRYRFGIFMGIISAFMASVFQIYNKKYSASRDPYTACTWEMAGGFLGIALIAPFYLMINGLGGYSFILKDWIYLFLLATVFTVLLYLMAIELSRKVSAFTFSLTFNL
ncbi:MAG: DMT family transporter, partial [Succinivibrio sp.]